MLKGEKNLPYSYRFAPSQPRILGAGTPLGYLGYYMVFPYILANKLGVLEAMKHNRTPKKERVFRLRRKQQFIFFFFFCLCCFLFFLYFSQFIRFSFEGKTKHSS